MSKYCLVCLLLAGMALGQAAGQNPEPAKAQPAAAIAPDATVVTIKGFCQDAASQKDPANCVTNITRADFEKVVDAVQPSMPPRSRRPFADRYARTLVMGQKALEMNLDKSPTFEERMKLVRMQILAQELGREMQEQASQVSDKDIQDYYNANTSKFDQVDLDRVYIPKEKQRPDGEKTPTPEEEKKYREESEKEMKVVADKIRARAAKGEDFTKLQDEAFKAANIQSEAPNVTMGKVRRSILAQNQQEIMQMKPGEISQVIDDPNGFYIYKLKAKDTLPFDQVKDEIKATLRSERLQAAMQALQQSVTVTFNDAYFGPDMPMRGPMMPHPMQPPAPKPAAAEPK